MVLSSLPLLALMLLYPCLPESPYWLLATGQTAAAEALLQRIADTNGTCLPRGRLQPSAAAAASKVQQPSPLHNSRCPVHDPCLLPECG